MRFLYSRCPLPTNGSTLRLAFLGSSRLSATLFCRYCLSGMAEFSTSRALSSRCVAGDSSGGATELLCSSVTQRLPLFRSATLVIASIFSRHSGSPSISGGTSSDFFCGMTVDSLRLILGLGCGRGMRLSLGCGLSAAGLGGGLRCSSAVLNCSRN